MVDYNKWPSIGHAYTGSSNNNDGQQASVGRGGGPVFEKPNVTGPIFEKPDFAANSGSNGGNNNRNKNKGVYGDNNFNEGSKSSLKIDVPKMNEPKLFAWCWMAKGNLVFLWEQLLTGTRSVEV
ncbi:hypothetical protein P8452_46713 [Trifolium repens]|nr:hypothetical protein P8452_46713 [Trifolium repens]